MNKPILFYSSTKKITMSSFFSLHGVNLKGNIVLKATNTSGEEFFFFIQENQNETYVELISEINANGKFKFSIARYEVNDGVVVYGEYSQEMVIYSYKTIKESKNNYCPVYNKAKYTDALVNLLPNGLFAKNKESNLYRLFSIFGEELANTNLMLCELKKELNPITTEQFLSLWEEEYNTESCGPLSSNVELRIKQLITKYIAVGGNTPYYFEYIAGLVGYNIRVEDENIFELMTCEDDCESSVVSEEMGFVWYINVFGYTEHVATCEDDCEDYLDWIEGNEIECFFQKIKPAHTILIFRYNIEYNLVTDDNKTIITNDDKNIIVIL